MSEPRTYPPRPDHTHSVLGVWMVVALGGVMFAMLLSTIALTIIAIRPSLDQASADQLVQNSVDDLDLPPGGTGIAVDTSTSVTPELTPVADLALAPADEVHVTYAPDAGQPITRDYQAKYEVRLEVIENVCEIDAANGIKIDMWGYRIEGDSEVACGSPGPILRGRVGDVVTITLTNLAGNTHPHNIDFHAVTGQGGGAADLTAVPGETVSIQTRLLYSGAFMYHCAYGDVPVHIMHGMYGMFIVDPETPLPAVAHEWAVVQSEWYLTEPDANGLVDVDKERLTDENPTYVVFNGAVGAIAGDKSLKMAVGEKARIYFVNEGLNLNSNFHPIGSHWDVVYPEAATTPGNPIIRGSQSTLVVAGGGTIVEVIGQVPQTILLVDHALSRTFYKGALGMIEVSGALNPEIFVAGQSAETDGGEAAPPPEGSVNVTITKDGWLDPSNAENAFSPSEITVEVGTTVMWTNGDAALHTVTSGTSESNVGAPDGLFDSGFLDPGATWWYTFTEEGEFNYFCTPHPWMMGKVIVTPAA
ncbi:MAG: plastocyanin/azurin family copper-binding protein [Acidimicrobiia bacterium]|nr:plastocyanin/azurin family copper-binding protein [Acidimicrobiia bacterium]